MLLHPCLFERFEINVKGCLFRSREGKAILKSKFSRPRPMPQAGPSDDFYGLNKRILIFFFI